MRWRPANSRIHRGSTEMVLVLRWVAASTAGQDGVLSRCDQVNALTQASLFNPSHAVNPLLDTGADFAVSTERWELYDASVQSRLRFGPHHVSLGPECRP